MKNFFGKHPILKGIVATILTFLATEYISFNLGIGAYFIGNGNETLTKAVAFLATALAAFIVLLIFGLIYRRKGFKGTFSFSKTDLKDVYMGLLIVVVVDIACFIFSTIFDQGGFSALVLPSFYTFALALSAGVSEETMFRAIPAAMMMRNHADDKRIITTVVLTSCIFGLAHLSNMLQGAVLLTTIIQVIACIGTGIFCVAIYLRSGSIVLPILFHFFHDYMNFMIPAQATGLMTQTSFTLIELIPEVALMAAEVGVGIYLLRKVNFDDILSTWKNKWSE